MCPHRRTIASHGAFGVAGACLSACALAVPPPGPLVRVGARGLTPPPAAGAVPSAAAPAATATLGGAAAELTIEITMSPATVDKLAAAQISLEGLLGARAAQPGGAPLIWLSTLTYGPSTTVRWRQSYSAFTSRTEVSPYTRVVAMSWYAVEVGQTLRVEQPTGTGTVVWGGPADSMSVQDDTTVAFSCGPALGQGAAVAPMALFPVYPGHLVSFAPSGRVALMFSPGGAPPGAVVERATGPAVVIDMDGASVRSVAFDINEGWSWDGGTWARRVPTGDPLTPWLIVLSPPARSAR